MHLASDGHVHFCPWIKGEFAFQCLSMDKKPLRGNFWIWEDNTVFLISSMQIAQGSEGRPSGARSCQITSSNGLSF